MSHHSNVLLHLILRKDGGILCDSRGHNGLYQRGETRMWLRGRINRRCVGGEKQKASAKTKRAFVRDVTGVVFRVAPD